MPASEYVLDQAARFPLLLSLEEEQRRIIAKQQERQALEQRAAQLRREGREQEALDLLAPEVRDPTAEALLELYASELHRMGRTDEQFEQATSYLFGEPS